LNFYNKLQTSIFSIISVVNILHIIIVVNNLFYKIRWKVSLRLIYVLYYDNLKQHNELNTKVYKKVKKKKKGEKKNIYQTIVYVMTYETGGA